MSARTPVRLTADRARRLALGAQGLARPRPGRSITRRDLSGVLDRLGLVQIDSVNVLARSHYLPFWARLGPYDTALLDTMRDKAPRAMVEYWAHEASLMPLATWPLLEHARMRGAEDGSWGGMRRVARDHPELVRAVESEVRSGRPRTARQIEIALGSRGQRGDRPEAEWGWNWSLSKTVLEYLFWAGRVTSAGRTSQFERRYAAPGAVATPALRESFETRHDWPGPEEAYRQLTGIALRAMGVATRADVSDYFRVKRTHSDPAIAALVADGRAREVTVAGWREPAVMWAEASIPRETTATALLSPFDSMVWCRPRIERLFDFHYRIEIYTPAAQRVHGYYVLPFLREGHLVGRVDLKADRSEGILRARRIHWEDGRGGASDRVALAEELGGMAGWLGLGGALASWPGSPPEEIAARD